MTTNTQWMIYGANGYTGELIAKEAVRQGLKPIVAGRSRDKVEQIASALGLQSRVFGLDSPEQIATHLAGMKVVLHCAGPFSVTAEPMMKACIKAGVHYLDITGEINVFEQAQALSAQAGKAGVVLCPGVGFDVIPTDCVAAKLKEILPDATHLSLGFDSRSGFSPGTAKTSVEGLAQGGKVRVNGVIQTVPLAFKVRKINFGDGDKLAMTIPWGDVSTAYHTTGIPNVETFIPGSPRMISNAKRANWIRPILGFKVVQDFIKRRIDKTVKGPSEKARDAMPTFVWGEARNASGQIKTVRIKTANGYSLTIEGSVAVAKHLLSASVQGGAATPSKLMGTDFVTTLRGSGAFELA